MGNLKITTVDEQIDEAMWDVKTFSKYVGKSIRWTWEHLRKKPNERGSIPHLRIGESPRFEPDIIRDWARAGCPPAEQFSRGGVRK